MSINQKEIERKFIVKNDDWKRDVVSFYNIEQYYLSTYPNIVVRIRKITISPDNCYHVLTFKSSTENSMVRNETEMDITPDKYEELKHFSEYEPIIKTRYIIETPDIRRWEVDYFHTHLIGKVLAEIELSSINETVNVPNWCGTEVTDNPIYKNDYQATRFKSTLGN